MCYPALPYILAIFVSFPLNGSVQARKALALRRMAIRLCQGRRFGPESPGSVKAHLTLEGRARNGSHLRARGC